MRLKIIGIKRHIYPIHYEFVVNRNTSVFLHKIKLNLFLKLYYFLTNFCYRFMHNKCMIMLNNVSDPLLFYADSDPEDGMNADPHPGVKISADPKPWLKMLGPERGWAGCR